MKQCRSCGEEMESECKKIKCPMCNGEGSWTQGDQQDDCQMCWGYGELHEDQEDMVFCRAPLCPWCNETDQVIKTLTQKVTDLEKANKWYGEQYHRFEKERNKAFAELRETTNKLSKIQDAIGGARLS